MRVRFRCGAGALLLAVIACNSEDPQGEGFSLSPQVVDFGEVVVGLLARRTLALDNGSPRIVRVIEARPADPISDAIRLERVPAAIAAGGSAEAEVVFAPPREGIFSGAIRILTDGDPAELEVEINGVATAPFLRAIPEQIDFGRVMLGESSVWTATVSNEGTKAVTVSSLTPDMETSEEFELGFYAIQTLQPGDSFSFEVTFRPAFPGQAIGRVVIGDDSPRPVPLGIALIGEGVSGDIEVEPSSIDFSGVVAGERRVRSFELRNTGTITHTIETIELLNGSPDTPLAFAVESSTTAAAPFLLAPGEERAIRVWFAPQDAGTYRATAQVRVSGLPDPLAVDLFGNVFSPPMAQISVRPRVLDFGGVELGSSGARELEIESPGSFELHLIGALELDPPTAPFMLVRAPPADATLSAFDSHTLEVVFRPETAGVHQAVLRIRSDSPAEPTIEVQLTGRGEQLASADADLRPTALDFGYVPRNLDVTRTLALVNGGTAPLAITGVELTMDADGRFTLVDPPDATPLLPGEARAIAIRYSDPFGLAVLRTATVAISTDDPDRPLIFAPLYAHTTPPRDAEAPAIRVHAGALDLHLLRAGGTSFDRPSDCCWCNPNPRWGDTISSRPFLYTDLDGTTIFLSRAEGTYFVEVHSRAETEATAEVTIELHGASPIVRSRAVGPGQRWRVGSIEIAPIEEDGSFSTWTLPLDTPMETACH